MGIMVTKDDDNSKLNQRITADLRERAARSSKIEDPDLVEDSDYVDGTKKTGSFGWVWIILVLLALFSLGIIIII